MKFPLGWIAGVATSCALIVMPALAQPLSTIFTYQGELKVSGAPAGGLFDLRFRLYDAPAGGNQVGPQLCSNNISLTNGRFTVDLDFLAVFAGQQRFLEIDVRADTGLGCATTTGFTLLAPRQPLTAAPYALFALNAATAASASIASSAANATQLGGQGASFYQNAANLTGGTIPDARLSGAYSGPLTFSNVGNTFAGGGTGLTGLNAGNLSSGTVPSGRLVGTYSNVLNFSNDANFYSGSQCVMEVSGPGSSAVVGVNISSNGTGVEGSATAATGSNIGVRGETSGPIGSGVFGTTTSATGATNGVYGRSASTTGRGVFGQAAALSGNTVGVYGEASSATGYAVYSNGDMRANGDLTATGSKTGYVSDIVLNGGGEPLLPGDLVEIIGEADPIIGDIPVIVVRKAHTAYSRAVLGPMDCALQTSPMETSEAPARPRYAHQQYHVHKIEGAIEPGSYGRAVTLGSFKMINVDASFGAIAPGDLLVSSSNPGFAMRSEDPRVGTVVGKALGSLAQGTGVMGVLVQGR